jgi:hypothetical protein
MKSILKLSVLAIISLFLFNKCSRCYPCVNKSDSFKLPYISNQVINFINDSQVIVKFTVNTQVQLPPSEYCGPIGSESYGSCQGDESATLNTSNNGNDLNIKIYFSTSTSDNVELPVYKYITVNNASFVIEKNLIRTSDMQASVKELNSITLNGKTYQEVIEYTRLSDSVNVKECDYILYSKIDGILKFQIKRAGYFENWTLND